MAETRAAEVREAVRAIRALHALGRRLPPKAAPRAAYGQAVVARAAEARGTNEDTIRKARAFADPVAGYTPAELDELCGLVEAVQPGHGKGQWVFRPSHVIRMLTVRPKGRRKALQVRAVNGGWSTARLEAEIAKAFGTRREGGRKPVRAETVEDWLVHTERLCETWRRWTARLDAVPGPDDESCVRRASLPPKLRESVRRATAEVRRLHELVAAELGRRVPTRAARPGLLDDAAGRGGSR